MPNRKRRECAMDGDASTIAEVADQAVTPFRKALRFLAVLSAGSLFWAVVSTGAILTVGSIPNAIEGKPGKPILLAPLSVRSIMYDSSGGELALIAGSEDREEVPLSRIPETVRTTIITVEDAAFYEHHGVSVKSITRALFSNVASGGVAEGGSTITQQVIKNSIVGSSQTLQRKIRETSLAIRLEEQMSKDEILERYLNTIFLGNHAFGVQAAAETYFNKNVEDLTWADAALITAIVRGPTLYDPIKNPRNAQNRRDLVAKRLLESEKINQQQFEEILAAPIPTTVQPRRQRTAKAQLVGGGYYAEEVRKELLSLAALGDTPEAREKRLLDGGLRIQTTYDEATQKAAEDATKKVPTADGKFFTGLVSVEPGTGAVKAMVGGPDFATENVNYTTQNYRAPGSTMKPIALITAFEQGIIPSDTISGAGPCWVPDVQDTENGGYKKISNFGDSPGKTADLTSQTLASSNCAFLRLGQIVGTPAIAEMAGKLGINTIKEGVRPFVEIPMTERVKGNLSTVPTGTLEVTPISMAAAYAAIAADGKFVKPYLVQKITDARGKVLYEHNDPGVQVFSVQTARMVAQMLEKNVQSGTGKRAALKSQPAAGKTGTGNNNTDAWFVGFTPYLATAVWIGNPEKQETVTFGGNDVEGGEFPAATWGRFNAAFHKDLPVKGFPDPAKSTRSSKYLKYSNPKDSGRSTTPSSSTRSTTPSRSRPRSSTTTVPKSSPTTDPPSGGQGGSGNGASGAT